MSTTPYSSPLSRLDVPGMGVLWVLWKRLRGADHRRSEVARIFNDYKIDKYSSRRRLRSLIDIGLWNDAYSLSPKGVARARRSMGCNVYHAATSSVCDPQMLHMMFEGGLDPEWNDQNNRFDGWTTIFARTAQDGCLRISLAAGCNPEIHDSCNDTALHLIIHRASSADDTEERDRVLALADEVIKAGHCVNSSGKSSITHRSTRGKLALQVAVERGSLPVIKWLFDRNASTSIPDGYGDFPLHWLASEHFQGKDKRWERVAALLVDHGAGLDATNSRGESPLWLAAAWGNVQAVEWLLGAGASTKIDPTVYRDPQGYEKPDQDPPTLLWTVCKNLSPLDSVSLRLIDEILKAKPTAWDAMTPEGVSIRQWLSIQESPWRALHDQKCLQEKTVDPSPCAAPSHSKRF